jgi:hypothetical protein
VICVTIFYFGSNHVVTNGEGFVKFWVVQIVILNPVNLLKISAQKTVTSCSEIYKWRGTFSVNFTSVMSSCWQSFFQNTSFLRLKHWYWYTVLRLHFLYIKSNSMSTGYKFSVWTCVSCIMTYIALNVVEHCSILLSDRLPELELKRNTVKPSFNESLGDWFFLH